MAEANQSEGKRREGATQMRSPSVKQMVTECLDLGRQTFEKLRSLEESVEIIAREIARQINPEK
jgi:hypothetical protein